MFLRTSLRATTLATLLSVSLGAWAQSGEASISDQDRAKRDASKVFNFIKFHAVRPAKPADKVAEKAPDRPADRAPELRVASAPPPPASAPALLTPARANTDVRVAALDPARLGSLPSDERVPKPAVLAAPAASEAPDARVAAPEASGPALAGVAPAVAALVANPQPAPSITPEPEPEPEDEVGLQLLQYVEPELPRSNSVNTLKGGTVTVRFEVGTDGKVVSAVPREGASRRLAQAAARAVQQWRFAPLSSAREAEVDIVFNLD